jgi:hypothetical protein
MITVVLFINKSLSQLVRQSRALTKAFDCSQALANFAATLFTSLGLSKSTKVT